MGGTRHKVGADLSAVAVWRYVLVCLAAVFLACASKNYLSVWLHDTFLCEYLCPSLFGTQPLAATPLLGTLFQYQHSAGQALQTLFDPYGDYAFQAFSLLVVAPVVEEAVYRGPLYLSRRARSGLLWWGLAALLTLVFALSHDRTGLALLPLIVLGLGAAWLIRVTGRFWPALALHFLHNFHELSVSVYQSFLWGA